MSIHQPTLFGGSTKLVYDEAVEMTLQSMLAYGPSHDHWVFAFSGGKDSTATLTVIIHRLSDFQGWNLTRTHPLSNRAQRLTG